MIISGTRHFEPLVGVYDSIIIYRHITNGTFHPAHYTERPLPGGGSNYVSFVRLQSKRHHTKGAPTLETARELARALQGQLNIPDTNVYLDVAVDWSGEIGDVLIVPDWLAPGGSGTFNPIST